MSAPGFLAKARQHVAVATSLVALIANLRAPLPVALKITASIPPARPSST